MRGYTYSLTTIKLTNPSASKKTSFDIGSFHVRATCLFTCESAFFFPFRSIMPWLAWFCTNMLNVKKTIKIYLWCGRIWLCYVNIEHNNFRGLDAFLWLLYFCHIRKGILNLFIHTDLWALWYSFASILFFC